MATASGPAVQRQQPFIRWRYSWIFVAGIALLIYALNSPSNWLLNWVHVFFGLAWTGIDLFMGFILGPILRRLEPDLRRIISTELSARFFFIFPMISTVTPTAGWELARRLGYLDLPYPQYWWIVATLVIVSILAFQGICLLMPLNLRTLWEMRKPEPDMHLIGRLMRAYLAISGIQGVLQLAIIVVMTRYRLGL
jgi:hypothetical protein